MGRPTVEGQHLFGKSLEPHTVVLMPGNVHRELDDMKDCWPDEVRYNTSRNPLMTLAADALAHRDWAKLWQKRWQKHADYLRHLDACLRRKHGDRWWDKLGLPDVEECQDDKTEHEDH
jgi:hypothetical protein